MNILYEGPVARISGCTELNETSRQKSEVERKSSTTVSLFQSEDSPQDWTTVGFKSHHSYADDTGLSLGKDGYEIDFPARDLRSRRLVGLLWDKYLRETVPRIIGEEHAQAVRKCWELFSEEYGMRLHPPYAYPEEDEDETFYVMSWRKEEHRFTIEVCDDGTYEWRYANRETRQLEGDVEVPTSEIDKALRPFIPHVFFDYDY